LLLLLPCQARCMADKLDRSMRTRTVASTVFLLSAGQSEPSDSGSSLCVKKERELVGKPQTFVV
jgi:hypothetical protein